MQKLALLALVVSPALALAQTPAEPAVSHVVPGGHTLDWLDGELWAGSPAYKARFEGGSVEFTPTLGPRAPRNYSLKWSLASVRRGAAVVHAVRAGDAVVPEVAGDSVEIARGTDIVERYDVRDDHIEQSFVFARPLRGEGDLVVRLRTETELRAAGGSRLAELDLRAVDGSVDYGGVNVGAVVGIDARGRRVRGHLDYDGEHLDLVLPHAFVASAAYPLVLDPPIGGRFSGGASFSDYKPDIAYDATGDFYLMIWEIHRSATDVDIWGTRYKSDRTGRSGVFVQRGAGIQRHPRIANINASDAFLVVFQDNANGDWDINGRVVMAASRAVSGLVKIASTSADEITPDVAGDLTTRDDDAVVVWDDEAVGIRAVEVEVKSASVFKVGVTTTLSPGKAPLRDNPAISRSGGTSRRAVVAWEHDATTLGARAWTLDLAVASAFVGFPLKHRDPEVDGDGTDFAIVFESPETAAPTSGDIWCWGVSVPATATRPLQTRSSPRQLAATRNVDERQPTIGFVGSRYFAAWAVQEPPSTSEYSVRSMTLSLASCTQCGSRWRSGDPMRGSGWPAIATQWSGGAAAKDGAWMIWEQIVLGRGRSLCIVQRFDAVAGGPVVSVAAGCSGGGTAAITGSVAPGERITVGLTGAAVGATAGRVTIGVPGNRQQLSCGACRFLVGPLSIGLPISAGRSRFAFSIPCNPFLLGAEIDLQFALAPTGGTPCPTVPGLAGSNILRTTIRD